MIKNTAMVNLKVFYDKWGHLIPLEENATVPFAIKRVYYIYNVEQGVRRGFHSHKNLQQALICVHGEVKILAKTPEEEMTVCLNDPSQALLIGPMVWREMYDFSDDAVLLVLASEHYDESDYIRSYTDYMEVYADYMENGTGMTGSCADGRNRHSSYRKETGSR